MRKLLITMMLLGSMQLSAGTKLNSLKNGMRSLLNKELVGKIQHFMAIGIVGTTMAVAVPQLAVGGEEHFNEVTAADPAYWQSVMLLRADDRATETAGGFHLLHVGSDADGNAVLLGRELALGSVLANFLGEDYDVSLYGWDGLIADNLTVNATKVFADKTDGIFNIVALTVEGLDLSDTYPAAAVDSSFPHDDAVALELLTYRLFYNSLLTEEEIAAQAFTLRQQDCNLEPNADAAQVAVGFTTCGNPTGHVALGSFIFHDGTAVALQSRQTGRRDKQVWLASGITQEAKDFANALSGNVTPVEARGKLATTWGALKQQ